MQHTEGIFDKHLVEIKVYLQQQIQQIDLNFKPEQQEKLTQYIIKFEGWVKQRDDYISGLSKLKLKLQKLTAKEYVSNIEQEIRDLNNEKLILGRDIESEILQEIVQMNAAQELVRGICQDDIRVLLRYSEPQQATKIVIGTVGLLFRCYFLRGVLNPKRYPTMNRDRIPQLCLEYNHKDLDDGTYDEMKAMLQQTTENQADGTGRYTWIIFKWLVALLALKHKSRILQPKYHKLQWNLMKISEINEMITTQPKLISETKYNIQQLESQICDFNQLISNEQKQSDSAGFKASLCKLQLKYRELFRYLINEITIFQNSSYDNSKGTHIQQFIFQSISKLKFQKFQSLFSVSINDDQALQQKEIVQIVNQYKNTSQLINDINIFNDSNSYHYNVKYDSIFVYQFSLSSRVHQVLQF